MIRNESFLMARYDGDIGRAIRVLSGRISMPATAPATDVLSNTALNRATLARQHLIARTTATMPVTAMVAHLGGMQAQAPLAPYFGLWSRLEDFDPQSLSDRIIDRSIVRIVTMRGTVHMHTVDDALAVRALTDDANSRKFRSIAEHKFLMTQIDEHDLLTFGRQVVEESPQALADLRPALTERWPEANPETMTRALNYLLPMVQVPPRGIWGASGQPRLTTLEAWTGRSLPDASEHYRLLDALVLRYLGAFGPASVQDAQMWSGLTRLNVVFARLAPQLVTFRAEDGRELFDLPDAPRPDEETTVPVRILAPFDNVLLGHKDRSRIMSAGSKPLMFTKNGLIRPTVLVDGFAAGIATTTRSKDIATLTIDLFHELSHSLRGEIEMEGLRLLAFAEPTAATHQVEFTL